MNTTPPAPCVLADGAGCPHAAPHATRLSLFRVVFRKQRRGCATVAARGRWPLPLSRRGPVPIQSPAPSLLAPCRGATCQARRRGFVPRRVCTACHKKQPGLGDGFPPMAAQPLPRAPGIPASSWALGKLRQRGRRRLARGSRGEKTGFLARAGVAALSARGRGLLFAGCCSLALPASAAVSLAAALRPWGGGGGHPGDRGSVPTGDTPTSALVKGVIVPPPPSFLPGGGRPPVLCVVGLAWAAGWPWPHARCRALFQRQLPVGTAWQPSCLRARPGQDPWAAGSPLRGVAATGAGATAVTSLQFSAQRWLFSAPAPSLKLGGDERGAGSPCPAEKSLWRGAWWLHPFKSDVSALKAPGFPSQSCLQEGAFLPPGLLGDQNVSPRGFVGTLWHVGW